MDFLDRVSELKRLNRPLATQESALIVLWGRRRIGKTRLLIEWIRSNNGLYWTADESAPAIQRKYLAQALDAPFPGFSDVDYPDWDALLSRIASEALSKNWRGPLVIDEFPYLVSASPELPSILQRWIDHQAKAAKLIVVLSGSSQSMMQGLVTDYSAPLYGRATEIFKLNPIPLSYIGSALNLSNPTSIIESYALWGGVPKYWELALPYGQDLPKAACELILHPDSPLHNEPNKLLLEEMPSAIALRPLLDAIGMGAHKLSEIAARLNQPASSLSRPILRLQELDLVVKELPFGENEKSSKKSLYKIKDPLTRFWFKVVAPKKSILAQCTPHVRLALFNQYFPTLASQAWEDIALSAFSYFDPTHLGIDWLPASRFWKGNGPEWDVVTQSLDGKHLFLGEAKWTSGPISTQYVQETLQHLMSKGLPELKTLSKHTTIHYALFLPQAPASVNLQKNTYLIPAKDLA